MTSSAILIQCPNPNCLHPENSVGQPQCDRCQTPLTYRYLWAIGDGVEHLPLSMKVGNRYAVMAPHIWLDTQPAFLPSVPDPLPDIALPYLHLYTHRLHIPTVYGFYRKDSTSTPILLLEDIPLDAQGQVLPRMNDAWQDASPVRQIYWLWQILELWLPLKAKGVASSLLQPKNLCVEGWRVRLLELNPDRERPPHLNDLATLWMTWLMPIPSRVTDALKTICQLMQTAEDSELGWKAIAHPLNQLLLEQATQLPLRLTIAGGTSTGSQRTHNEDACYPLTVGTPILSNDPLIPHVAIICDGIGGHAGGEVASQMALRSLQLQILALLTDIAEQPELNPPEVIAQQLETLVRIVNNIIAEQNNTQKRESRQRMGTTLVMALQLPQALSSSEGSHNSHELYVVNVGDSRAYWLTPNYCHLLTVDDDVAVRETRAGRSVYRESRRRSDAGALTQALGTRDGEFLNPTVQRFIVEEDGLLLLCSDGLSDGDRIEHAWQETTHLTLIGKLSLNEAIQFWLDLANRQNGHDNISVVLLHCQIASDQLELANKTDEHTAASPLCADDPTFTETTTVQEPELLESTRALLYDERSFDTHDTIPESSEPHNPQKPLNTWAITLSLAIIMFFIGAIGIAVWRETDPAGFERTFEQLSSPQN